MGKNFPSSIEETRAQSSQVGIEISLNLQKRMESELDSYKKLYRITVEIDKELNDTVLKEKFLKCRKQLSVLKQ